MSYMSTIERSIVRAEPQGISRSIDINPTCRDHQRHGVQFTLEQGRGALFYDTGLGKSLCCFEWARHVEAERNKPVLMFAPLGVAHQHVREAYKFGYDARVVKTADDIRPGLNITNYERLHHFDPHMFGGVVLDESSIIKSFTGITTRKLMAFAEPIPFRLAATATPAPNDHMELGQHSQWLGVMRSNEMLSRWFIADQRNMGRYRLKRHAVKSFWNWVASWSRACAMPSDLGFSDDGYVLPPLDLREHMIRADLTLDRGTDGDQLRLLRIPDTSATAIHKEKRLTVQARARVIADLVAAEPSESWIVWCETDYEADALASLIPDALEVRGSMSPDMKEQRLAAFSDGTARVLITKPSIAGFGLNWQHCARVAFVGLSFSYEQFYQAVRRCWRFGQMRPVHVHVAMADTENAIWQVIKRKSHDHDTMNREMRAAMSRAVERRTIKNDYAPKNTAVLPCWLKGTAA